MNQQRFRLSRAVLSTLLLFVIQPAFSQDGVTAQKVTDTIYMVIGKGGNIGVLIGEDGTFMIDDKFAGMSDAIFEAVQSVGGDTPRFLINTHFHGDHTGGNEYFGSGGANIVAHHNVYKRLAEGSTIPAFNMEAPPAPGTALPVLTYETDLDFHLNGDHVRAIHAPAAHTDGDSWVWFQESNVIHTGDIFFNGFYPFIDVGNGGSVSGVINAVNNILQQVDNDTIIIPGHGSLAKKPDLMAYRDMLMAAHERLSKLKADGKSAEEAAATNPLAEFEEGWGGVMFDSTKWISLIYDGL